MRVSFPNAGVEIAGVLHLPPDFDEGRAHAAIVVATPGSSVKEQVGAVYGERLAAEGYVVLAFDPSYQGESGGAPRDFEDPATRVEDLRCAVDFLTTLAFVDADRIGFLGVCAGGGYAVNAALTERRVRAVGVVAPVNIGRALREAQPDMLGTLETVGRQRTMEARGDEERRDPWIPDSLEEARAAGVTDRDILEAIEFYRESPYRRDTSTNRLYFRSFGTLLGFDAFHLVPELLTQPLQVIVGGRRGITKSYEDGEWLSQNAPNAQDFFVVEDAGHYEMYSVRAYVEPAVARLAAFYGAHLGAMAA